MSRSETTRAILAFIWVLSTEIVFPLSVISLALFMSVGYVLTLILPVTIEHWRLVFWLTLLPPLLMLALRASRIWRQKLRDFAPFSWRLILPFLPLLILAPTLLLELTDPTLQVRAHLDIHGAYIYQLLHGSTPIESAFLAGLPANYYWMYHAYFAAIASLTQLSPPYAITLMSLLFLSVSLVSVGRIVVAVKLARAHTVLLGCMILAAFFSINATTVFSVLAHLADGTFVEHVSVTLLPGANRHLHSTLLAATDISSMSMAFALFSVTLWTCVSIFKRGLNLFRLTMLSSCVITALAVQQVAALAILAISVGGLALTALLQLWAVEDKRSVVQHYWQSTTATIGLTKLLLWFAISAAGTVALLIYSLRIAQIASSDFPFGFFSFLNFQMIVAALLLYLPFFIIQFALLWRRSDTAAVYMQVAGSILLVLSLILGLPDTNQYKLVFFMGIPISLSALMALQRLESFRVRWIGSAARIVTLLLIALVLLQTIFVTYYNYYLSQNHVDRGFQYADVHLLYEEEPYNRLSAYYWIRTNTPTDAVIIQPLYSYRYANVLMERSLYAKRTQSSTLWQHMNYVQDGVPIYTNRTEDLELFFEYDLTDNAYRGLLEKMASQMPGRHYYAVVKDEEINPNVMARRGAVLVFEHETDGANVYLLHPQTGQ